MKIDWDPAKARSNLLDHGIGIGFSARLGLRADHCAGTSAGLPQLPDEFEQH